MSRATRHYHHPPQFSITEASPPPSQQPAWPALTPAFIANYIQDNYLQAPRFYIVTALFVVFQVIALFSYAIVLNWDSSALDLEPEAAANLVLGASALIVFALTLWGVSREVRVEYAFFACAIWFIYNTITSESCLCCVGSASTTEHHDHGANGASSVLDAVNHRLVDAQASCTNETLVYSLQNGFFILLIILNYIVILVYDCDYQYWLTVIQDVLRMRKLRADARANASLVNADSTSSLTTEETVTDDAVTQPSWIRIVLLVFLLGLAAVPLACNNVQRLSFVMLLGKCCIVLTLVSLRLTNTYLTRYVHVKTAATHLELVANPNVTQRFDSNILRSAEAHNLLGQPVVDILKQVLFARWTVQCITDVALGATALILCNWFLFACLAQLLAEVYILATMHTRWSAHMATLTRILGVNSSSANSGGGGTVQM